MEETTREVGFIKPKPTQRDLIEVETERAIQEVQASMIIAKRFPRDQEASYLRIMTACERFNLADQAEYAYPRGGKSITGPSIRLAECLAQNWGNLQFGIRELSQSGGESEVEAFAWDLETNTRQVKTFKVPHKRYTKAKGNVSLVDPRDIYEYVANQGARRMRACILGIIPGDIVDAAEAKCRETVKKGMKAKPLIDQVRSTLKAFDSLSITKDMVEQRLGHATDAITEDELVELNNIGRSIKDNITNREEWFDLKGFEKKEADELTSKIKNGSETQKPDPKKSTLSEQEQKIYDGWINIRKPESLRGQEKISRPEMPSWTKELRKEWSDKWLRIMREPYAFGEALVEETPMGEPDESKPELEPGAEAQEETTPPIMLNCPQTGETVEVSYCEKECSNRENATGAIICMPYLKYFENINGG